MWKLFQFHHHHVLVVVQAKYHLVVLFPVEVLVLVSLAVFCFLQFPLLSFQIHQLMGFLFWVVSLGPFPMFCSSFHIFGSTCYRGEQLFTSNRKVSLHFMSLLEFIPYVISD